MELIKWNPLLRLTVISKRKIMSNLRSIVAILYHLLVYILHRLEWRLEVSTTKHITGHSKTKLINIFRHRFRYLLEGFKSNLCTHFAFQQKFSQKFTFRRRRFIYEKRTKEIEDSKHEKMRKILESIKSKYKVWWWKLCYDRQIKTASVTLEKSLIETSFVRILQLARGIFMVDARRNGWKEYTSIARNQIHFCLVAHTPWPPYIERNVHRNIHNKAHDIVYLRSKCTDIVKKQIDFLPSFRSPNKCTKAYESQLNWLINILNVRLYNYFGEVKASLHAFNAKIIGK